MNKPEVKEAQIRTVSSGYVRTGILINSQKLYLPAQNLQKGQGSSQSKFQHGKDMGHESPL